MFFSIPIFSLLIALYFIGTAEVESGKHQKKNHKKCRAKEKTKTTLSTTNTTQIFSTKYDQNLCSTGSSLTCLCYFSPTPNGYSSTDAPLPPSGNCSDVPSAENNFVECVLYGRACEWDSELDQCNCNQVTTPTPPRLSTPPPGVCDEYFCSFHHTQNVNAALI